jgi:murein DD-endopeptidase MepM/ murein hydrolase activator NlpD
MGVTTEATAAPPTLKRQIELGMQGLDVKACKRAAARAGFPKGKLAGITGTYIAADQANIEAFQTANGLHVDGVIGTDTFGALLPHMDAFALELYDSFDMDTVVVAPAAALAYPHPSTFQGPSPTASDLHQTAGLANNWALDFMAPGGTPVLAPEDGTVFKLSGHDPSGGVTGGDIFGWNVYLHTLAGMLYFATHLGDRSVTLAEEVKLGDVIGHVGHWPNDPSRSHTHLGITHPAGVQAAKDYVCKVAAAARVPGQLRS